MPIYQYACTNCGERTEAKQKFDDPPLEECPHCGGKLRKMYSPVGIVFKGSGFYSTDAKRSGKSGATTSGDKGTSTDSSSSSSSGSSSGGSSGSSSGGSSGSSSGGSSGSSSSDTSTSTAKKESST